MRRFTKQPTLILLTLVLLACGVGLLRADQFRDTKNLPYDGQLRGFSDLNIRFRLQTGASVNKPISQVAYLQVTGADALNKAEDLARDGDYAEAIEQYDAALNNARTDWMKQIIRLRRYQALSSSGRTDEAVEAWLGLLDEYDAAAAVRDMKPSEPFAEPGSDANAKAVDLLDARAEKLEADLPDSRGLLLEMLRLQMAIQEANDDEAGATRTAQRINRITQGEAVEGDGPAPPAGGPNLAVLRRLLEAGQAEEVVRQLRGAMDGLEMDQRPEGHLLLGRGLQARAMKPETPDEDSLTLAGLHFAWVATQYPESTQAPEALFRAGEVCEALGDGVGAQQAYHAVVRNHPQADPWARQAQQRLNELSK